MGLQVVIEAKQALHLNGAYDLDFDFDMGELSFVKKAAGLRGLEVDEALDKGDTDLIACLGVIGAVRAGKFQEANAMDAYRLLMKEKVGAVYLTDDEPQEAETPEAPAGTPEPGGTPSSSSSSSTPPSDGPPETTPEATGVPV